MYYGYTSFMNLQWSFVVPQATNDKSACHKFVATNLVPQMQQKLKFQNGHFEAFNKDILHKN